MASRSLLTSAPLISAAPAPFPWISFWHGGCFIYTYSCLIHKKVKVLNPFLPLVVALFCLLNASGLSAMLKANTDRKSGHSCEYPTCMEKLLEGSLGCVTDILVQIKKLPNHVDLTNWHEVLCEFEQNKMAKTFFVLEQEDKTTYVPNCNLTASHPSAHIVEIPSNHAHAHKCEDNTPAYYNAYEMNNNSIDDTEYADQPQNNQAKRILIDSKKAEGYRKSTEKIFTANIKYLIKKKPVSKIWFHASDDETDIDNNQPEDESMKCVFTSRIKDKKPVAIVIPQGDYICITMINSQSFNSENPDNRMYIVHMGLIDDDEVMDNYFRSQVIKITDDIANGRNPANEILGKGTTCTCYRLNHKSNLADADSPHFPAGEGEYVVKIFRYDFKTKENRRRAMLHINSSVLLTTSIKITHHNQSSFYANTGTRTTYNERIFSVQPLIFREDFADYIIANKTDEKKKKYITSY